ncbi:MAG: DPP IV N-terminal domain-containing protein, partial [Flavobacteriia bacterium]
MKRIITTLFIGLSVITFAQKKQLTLKESVTQQYRAFGADKMPFFQWIPNTNEYTYLEAFTTLKKGNLKSEKAEKFMTIDELNAALGSKLNWFSGFEWKDQYVFLVNDGTKFYSYDTKEKKGRLILEVNEEAANQTYHNTTEKLAYTIANNLQVRTSDGKTIIVTNNPNAEIVSGQTYARSEFGITGGIFWSPNGNYLAFAQKDEGDVADYPLLDINETPGKLKSIKYPMAGQLSEKPRIGIFNFKTKYTSFITPKSSTDGYLTNVCWTPDEKFILIAEVNRGQNHMWLNLYNAESGNFVKTLFEETNDKWIEPEHPAFFPSDASNNFVWISERDGFNNLYYYDIDGKLIQQLTANKFVTKEIVSAINKGKEIVFCATGENPTNNLYYAVDLKGKQRLLTKNEGTHAICISSDAKFIFDEFSSHTIPSKSLVLDANGAETKTLLVSDNKLKDYAIGTTEIKVIKGKDGSDLYTRLIKPSNFDPNKKYPVMVYVYGGPHAQMITNSWLDGANLWMHWMAEQ